MRKSTIGSPSFFFSNLLLIHDFTRFSRFLSSDCFFLVDLPRREAEEETGGLKDSPSKLSVSLMGKPFIQLVTALLNLWALLTGNPLAAVFLTDLLLFL